MFTSDLHINYVVIYRNLQTTQNPITLQCGNAIFYKKTSLNTSLTQNYKLTECASQLCEKRIKKTEYLNVNMENGFKEFT